MRPTVGRNDIAHPRWRRWSGTRYVDCHIATDTHDIVGVARDLLGKEGRKTGLRDGLIRDASMPGVAERLSSMLCEQLFHGIVGERLQSLGRFHQGRCRGDYGIGRRRATAFIRTTAVRMFATIGP